MSPNHQLPCMKAYTHIEHTHRFDVDARHSPPPAAILWLSYSSQLKEKGVSEQKSVK